jgi:hypothetical protein
MSTTSRPLVVAATLRAAWSCGPVYRSNAEKTDPRRWADRARVTIECTRGRWG